MSESNASVKKQSKRNILLILAIGLVLAVITAGVLIPRGINYLFPKPLTLKPEEKVKGRILLDSAGPFYIGDLIPITLLVESRTGVTYATPDLVEINPRVFQIKDRAKPVYERRQNGQVLKLRYLITSWEIGTFSIPSFKVDYQYNSTAAGKFTISGRKIKISSLLPANKTEEELLKLDIKDLKGPVGLAPRYQLLWWFLAGIILLVFVWLLIRKLQKMAALKETESGAGIIPVEPAHVIALRRLETIRNSDYLSKGDFKTYYSELSECLREYMENRFQIRALEMTTEEFLSYLSTSHHLQLEFEMIIKDFMNSSDLVKFAKHMPLLEEAERALNLIQQLIESTKEVPAAESEPPTGTNQTENLEEQVS